VALRRNLARSHACRFGEPLSEPEVRAMLLLRANVLAKGLSGIHSQIVEMLVSFLKRRVHPVVPARGSVGASGDFAPLAHVALVLIGGRVLRAPAGRGAFQGHAETSLLKCCRFSKGHASNAQKD
jgi:histidine ammonia-lyase